MCQSCVAEKIEVDFDAGDRANRKCKQLWWHVIWGLVEV